MLTAVLFIVFSTRCRRPPVRTSVLMMSKTTSWTACFAAAHHWCFLQSLAQPCRLTCFQLPMLLRYLVVPQLCCYASCFLLQSRALQCQQLCFQLQMLLRYHVDCHLCCCGSCFFLQSLVLHLQQECFLLLQLLRYFFHRFLCHVLLFLFWRRLFFIVTIIS